MRLIKERGGVIVRNIQLLDCYSGRQIPDGKIGLTYRVEYRDPSRTLEDSVVNAAHAAIVDGLGKELGAKLR
jgi:phenylalanyl-tRNA synthetase beta chain